ncbi:hypothetical protein GCM10023210_31250 [Chryseobacterium ginsengisoli]|uniref:Uncharacterized protein n=1 Tax=Chryseobacterium ginsengisoli TaxID=363853 RepID=A0ABP9MKW2_9FLAO
MKKLSIKALLSNLILAFLFAIPVSAIFKIDPFVLSAGVTLGSVIVQYFVPKLFSGKLMNGLQTEVWVPGIKENPVPDTSFVYASVDMSEHVEHNKLHLAEAGIEPGVHEDYFLNNDDGELPFATIQDIPNEVILKTYSTEQTRHRDLQEIEFAYNKKESVIKRHRISLGKNLGKRAAHIWSPSSDNGFNKIMNLSATDSIIDALVDLEAFYSDLDLLENLNVCFNAQHMARIKKEDKKLYKDILNEKQMYGFKVWRYSQNPIYTAEGEKLPYGSVKGSTDKRSSFTWCTDEVFRCFGDVKMYATIGHSGLQADTLSFAQRALVGNIRATNPKYLGAIL